MDKKYKIDFYHEQDDPYVVRNPKNWYRAEVYVPEGSFRTGLEHNTKTLAVMALVQRLPQYAIEHDGTLYGAYFLVPRSNRRSEVY